MELTHAFEVPTPLAETWAHFHDIEALAECFPGAQVTSVEGDSFTGQAKVKLGPIALVYLGSGAIVERDEAAHRMLVEAKGKDKRGNGTAGATVTLSMTGSDAGTSVEVRTDLSITGKPAQFGRGVMQDVSDRLLGQFVVCLEQRLAGSPEGAAEVGAEVGAEEADGPEGAAEGGTTPVQAAAPTGPAAPAGSTARPAASASSSDDALDLGATVLPVLVKSYWRQALGAAAIVVLVRRLVRRRR